jgi:hypothetical protein
VALRRKKISWSEKKPDLAAERHRAALALDPQNKALREALKSSQRDSHHPPLAGYHRLGVMLICVPMPA